MKDLSFPLRLRFKVLSLTNRVQAIDANGKSIAYIHQKLLKLREDVKVYVDDSRQEILYSIQADRIIDWSAKYNITDASGQPIGSMGRKGTRSLWRAYYEIFDKNGSQLFFIKENNAFVKFADAFFSELPVIGILSGYVFNPSYTIFDMDQQPVATIKKKRAMFESEFVIEEVKSTTAEKDILIVLSAMMVTILERVRG